MRQPVRAVLASYPTGAPAMFVSHVSAMPLHMQARGGRGCIVSVLLACLPGMFRSSPAVPLHARAGAGRASSYPSGAPAMFVSHVSAMPLSACELVVAVCASYRCSRHVYQACLSHAQQCLCLREPVRAVCASYRCSRHVYSVMAIYE